MWRPELTISCFHNSWPNPCNPLLWNSSKWFIASQWQQGRGHVNCSIQILPEAESAASGWIVIWAICHREPSGIDPKVAAVGDSSQMCLLTERVCLVSFSSGTSCFDDRWSPLVRSPTKNARKADPDFLISERLASVVESQCCWAPFWSCRSCLKPSVTDSLLLGGSKEENMSTLLLNVDHLQGESHRFEACDKSEQDEMPRWGREKALWVRGGVFEWCQQMPGRANKQSCTFLLLQSSSALYHSVWFVLIGPVSWILSRMCFLTGGNGRGSVACLWSSCGCFTMFAMSVSPCREV